MPTKAKPKAKAKAKPKAKSKVSQSDEAFLRKKAESSRFSYGTLKKVLQRGKGAYLSSGSRNVSMTAWARGRVNSFVSGKGGARKADKDLLS